MLLDPRRTVQTPFSSGPILLFPWFTLLPDSFAKRRDLRGLATALGRGREMGTCTRPRSCCSPNLLSARNTRVHTFWSYFSVGRLLERSFLRRSRGTPEALFHLSDLSTSRARARACAIAVVRFDHNRNNGKRLFGCRAQDLPLPVWEEVRANKYGLCSTLARAVAAYLEPG